MSQSSPHVGIVTDSTADLPHELLQSLSIKSVPALLIIDEDTYIDGVDLSREHFYQQMPEMHQPATTAAPSPLVFSEAYEALLSSGLDQILSIHVSSGLSGIVNAAHQAAQAFGDRVTVFDSQQVSLGLGYQVIEAARAALSGLQLRDIIERMLIVKDNVRLLALIDSLEYLRRGGRVSWLQAGMSDLLSIKLLVTITDGVVESLARARTFTRALKILQDEARSWAPLSDLTILHAGVAERATELAEELRPLSSKPLMIVNVTTVIGAHVGPGSIGIAGLPQI